MADEKQDIFGKIDALFERRVGFGASDPRGRATEDFPLLTDVVSPGDRPAAEERRQTDRRQSDRRGGERRQAWPEGGASFTDAQFARFLGMFEKKLEDLFIRQQLRMEESIRQAVSEALRNREDEAG